MSKENQIVNVEVNWLIIVLEGIEKEIYEMLTRAKNNSIKKEAQNLTFKIACTTDVTI